MKMSLSKAQLLNSLKSNLKYGEVLDLYFCTVGLWRSKRKECLRKISSSFPNVSLFIVRSSSRQEDQLHTSNAGKYKSILNVKPENLAESIDSVIASYGEDLDLADEFLIQPMLSDVLMSGVLFTKDPKNGAPYYIANYDTNGNTTSVTGGADNLSQVLFVARCASHIPDAKIKQLKQLAEELEKKLGIPSLDIEFAFDKKEILYLLQVRPLCISQPPIQINQEKIIEKIKNKFDSLKLKHPYLSGNRTILAIMPDWNPAEIIGIKPKPLALSLYKELITDSTWAYQRDNYGYKNLRSFPLLIDLMGLPYIDVRVSFNSFVPKCLSPEISDKLVNYYLGRLENEPFLHDKVEFDIVFSCYTFDLKDRMRVLEKHGFNQEEIGSIEQSLRYLTNNIIHRDQGLWLTDIEKIDELKKRHETIFSNHQFDYLTKIYWLTEDCKRYGTLPFAGLARAGFIAVQLLNSMVSIDVLTNQEKMLFLNGLDSISTTMAKDLAMLDKEHFLHKYGHLRPGTYDILSPRYDETPDIYFDWDNIKDPCIHKKEEFKLTLTQMKKIEALLKEHTLEHDVVGLFAFIKSAIEGREYSKFIFTKTLSDVLFLLKKLAKEHNLELEDMAYLDIQKFLKLYSNSWGIGDELRSIIELGKNKYDTTCQLNLPPVIVSGEEIEYFYLPHNKPNFVTMRAVTARTISDLSDPHNIKESIVFLPSADPGFDWIFTHGIVGFVTAYGGVNSHMAIRASELSIPAVIGAGEKLYNEWKQAERIHIDCSNQRVEILH